MKSFISIILNQFSIIWGILFPSDGGPMSKEVRDILSNPEDKKKYIEGVNEFNKNVEKEDFTIILSGGKTITLIR